MAGRRCVEEEDQPRAFREVNIYGKTAEFCGRMAFVRGKMGIFFCTEAFRRGKTDVFFCMEAFMSLRL
jgi:hypothetical protein